MRVFHLLFLSSQSWKSLRAYVLFAARRASQPPPLVSRYSQFRRDQPAMSCNYCGRCTNSRRNHDGALGLVFASAAPTCNKPNPLIEPPQECFCRRFSIREDYNTRVTVDERHWRQVNAGRMPLVRHAGKYQLASLMRNLAERQALVTEVRALVLCAVK